MAWLIKVGHNKPQMFLLLFLLHKTVHCSDVHCSPGNSVLANQIKPQQASKVFKIVTDVRVNYVLGKPNQMFPLFFCNFN